MSGGAFMTDKSLGQYLKELRGANNYTQEYIASYLNITRQAYSHYETGRVSPNTETLCKISDFYNVPISILLELYVPSESISQSSCCNFSTIPDSCDDLISDFYKFINNPANIDKIRQLARKEKELIYYFENITIDDQHDLLEYLRIKVHNKIKREVTNSKLNSLNK